MKPIITQYFAFCSLMRCQLSSLIHYFFIKTTHMTRVYISNKLLYIRLNLRNPRNFSVMLLGDI